MLIKLTPLKLLLFFLCISYIFVTKVKAQKTNIIHYDLVNGIEYDSNGSVLYYDFFPVIMNVFKDTITIVRKPYILILYDNRIIKKIHFFEYFITYDRIINCIKYLRFVIDDKMYFLDKNKISGNISLKDYPYIIINDYEDKMSNLSYSYNYRTIYSNYKSFRKINYDEELKKYKLNELPDSLTSTQYDFDYFNDCGNVWVQLNSEKYIAFYLYEQNVKNELRYLKIKRNTIYAYYGRTFNTPWLQEYFNSQPWYKPNPNYSEDMLNKYDKEEIKLLLDMEKKLIKINKNKLLFND
jgi:hypothetical protein